ncbi:MAG: helix-turn-helix transcriptional regulator [Chloroflexi bacterium]|nr:helix-turn-helix transcriptional regulator [Chloroflexota bacterium]
MSSTHDDARRGAAARMVRYARRKAGLSQRGLSVRSGVPQETIARIERSRVSPRFDTVERLLDAAGYAITAGPRRGDGIDRSQIQDLLAMDPSTRARTMSRSNENLRRLLAAMKRS